MGMLIELVSDSLAGRSKKGHTGTIDARSPMGKAHRMLHTGENLRNRLVRRVLRNAFVLQISGHVVRKIFGVSRLVVRKHVIVARPIARALVLNAFVALLFLLLLLFSKVWHFVSSFRSHPLLCRVESALP